MAQTPAGTSGCQFRSDALTFLFGLPRRFWRSAPFCSSWFLPLIWVDHEGQGSSGPFRPNSRDECSINKLPFRANANRAVDFRRHQMRRALFSAVLGRTVPLRRRGELAACVPANPFPLSAWIFCLFAVMERLNGRALKGFFFLWTSFLPKINHHVGVTVTGNIGTVFIFFI